MGGEPLMHPDIVEVVRQAKSLGFEGVCIVTNAFLLTKEMASDLKKAGLDALTVSIDSITPTQSSKKALNLVKKQARNRKRCRNLHRRYWGSSGRTPG